MGAHWKYKVTCACLIKKLWILNEVVMMAKTGRVASNGFIYRGGGGKTSFFREANNWDWYCSHAACKMRIREVLGYI